MNTLRHSMLAGLLGLVVTLPVQAQGPIAAVRAHDPWLGQAIAAQGNQALLQIRNELQQKLHSQTPSLPQFAATSDLTQIASAEASRRRDRQ